MPVFIGDVEMDSEGKVGVSCDLSDSLLGNPLYKPFEYKELDASNFPTTSHARGGDVQYTVHEMR